MIVLTAGDGPYDEKRLRSGCHRVGKRGVRRLMRPIFRTGEEAHERPALVRDVVAKRAAQHWIAGLERVEDRALRNLPFNLELHLAAHARQNPQMRREHHPDHASV